MILIAWERAALCCCFGGIPCRPQLLDEAGQNVRLPRKPGIEITRHGIALGCTQGQSERIDEECSDDARIQALEVEHQYVPVQAGYRVEYIPTRDCRYHRCHRRRHPVQHTHGGEGVVDTGCRTLPPSHPVDRWQGRSDWRVARRSPPGLPCRRYRSPACSRGSCSRQVAPCRWRTGD